jgi:site-specific recombinase XerC
MTSASATLSGNPVDGVKRRKVKSNEGKTSALGDAQARQLLDAPPADTLKGVRDRAILATLLYHALRRECVARSSSVIWRSPKLGTGVPCA